MVFVLADPSRPAVPGAAGLQVTPFYAPVRRLDSGALAAVEVQLRGPADGPLATAEALRAAARTMSEKRHLDRLKWSVAQSRPVRTVPALVAMDIESVETLDVPDAEGLRHDVVVITEESLIADPSRTLRAVADARRRGKVVAVDDVGSRPQSLALLPLVEPDVIVLAPRLSAHRADDATARTAHAVAAQVERTGALVIADGVDTELCRRRALALGATYGLGALYPAVDTPEQLAGDRVDPFPPIPVRGAPSAETSTPFAIASDGRRPVHSVKRLLVAMSTSLENQAGAAGPETIVLGTFQYARNFGERTRARWQYLADRVAYAGVYGVGLGPCAEARIHHASLDPDDPLVEEWNVVVLGPYFACVLSAVDRHRGTDDLDREFDYVVSYDRGTVVRCARSILDRFTTA
ncbi:MULTISPECIES: EAL domain-containing protein [Rhodococcus]|uniref:EAL domain-containing protein n=1 Tax=Rhodococcus TaxID=1827 RepID=UPI00112215FB|nr:MULTISPECIES: EAL domain-containing protein [Rhodococcus]MCZ1070903.1 EAL domain-containing protein [Rhodococcus sp. A5(2022)]QRE80274.1 EAL domain-containing protein [Rhodococcus ruber]